MQYSTRNIPNKENVLRRFPEIDIFNWYMGTHLTERSFFCNPFRSDHYPTCNFYRGKDDRLRMIDRAGYFHGDCFDLVATLNTCSYHDAIKIIWDDLNSGSRSVDLDVNHFAKINKVRMQKPLTVKVRPWDMYALEYWQQFGIGEPTLKHFNVHPVEVAWHGGKFKQNELGRWQDSDPIYGYHLGKGQWKLYFPKRRQKGKLRFMSNTNVLQGVHQLVPSSHLVITKSLKDVMVLYTFGIPAVAPHSENHVIAEIDQMLHHYEAVFVLFDNDYPGKRGMVRYAHEGCIPLLIKEAKDLSDFRRDFGYDATKEKINEVKRQFGIRGSLL